jgi:hypothetical protein
VKKNKKGKEDSGSLRSNSFLVKFPEDASGVLNTMGSLSPSKKNGANIDMGQYLTSKFGSRNNGKKSQVLKGQN